MINYSKLAIPIKSKGRIYKENLSSIRSPYQRDRDRIIHSTAFRRLKHKTQVFINTSSDHFRTRITHSLEVSQIGRTLARYFNLNEDLTETLCLSHDLGHTPFGHAGEEVLNECMSDHGGFDHNLQTVRIVMLLEKKYYSFNGLNLTSETLEGLLKHNGLPVDKYTLVEIVGRDCLNKKIGLDNGLSFEAQIAAISDDIAYNSHDLEDGLKAQLFKLEHLNEIMIIKNLYKFNKKKFKNIDQKTLINIITRNLINVFVTDIIKETQKNIKNLKLKKFQDLDKQKDVFVNFSKPIFQLDKELKSFLNQKMYNNKIVKQNTDRGKKIIENLFKKIKKKPLKYIKKEALNLYSKERCIADFIAGMTDRYAIKLNKSI